MRGNFILWTREGSHKLVTFRPPSRSTQTGAAPMPFILLKRTPDGDLALFGHELEPLSDTEADRAAERYVLNTLAAGGKPDPIVKWEVVAQPMIIDEASIGGGKLSR